MREETVTVKIDHPLGSTDEDNPRWSILLIAAM